MRALAIAVIALGGCDYVWSINHWPDARPPLPDSDLVPIDAGPCANGTIVGMQPAPATGMFSYCVPNTAVGTYILPVLFDTMVAGNCDDTPVLFGVELCVKYADYINVTNPVLMRGTRPLVLIGIHGVLVANNVRLDNGGPNADSPYCQALDGAGHDGFAGNLGGAGGGGGSFGVHVEGGIGGTGNAVAGAAGKGAAPDRFRGGCPGGKGGVGAANATGGAGGDSGGALYLLSNDLINIVDNINAVGGPGAGGQKAGAGTTGAGGGGGGGGGSGGMVVLDAPTIMVSAHVFANGAGGGGGGGATANGMNGSASTGTTFDMPAAGGPGGDAYGGKGGDGSALGAGGTAGLASKAGGGGGGGGGYILLYTPNAVDTTKMSPTPYINGH